MLHASVLAAHLAKAVVVACSATAVDTEAVVVAGGATPVDTEAVVVPGGATDVDTEAVVVLGGATDVDTEAVVVAGGATDVDTEAVVVAGGATADVGTEELDGSRVLPFRENQPFNQEDEPPEQSFKHEEAPVIEDTKPFKQRVVPSNNVTQVYFDQDHSFDNEVPSNDLSDEKVVFSIRDNLMQNPVNVNHEVLQSLRQEGLSLGHVLPEEVPSNHLSDEKVVFSIRDNLMQNPVNVNREVLQPLRQEGLSLGHVLPEEVPSNHLSDEKVVFSIRDNLMQNPVNVNREVLQPLRQEGLSLGHVRPEEVPSNLPNERIQNANEDPLSMDGVGKSILSHKHNSFKQCQDLSKQDFLHAKQPTNQEVVNFNQSALYIHYKAERDSLSLLNSELERRLERKDTDMHEKEDELFLQLEKAIRLEEDCEKLKAEKEKIIGIKDKLEKEKNEAYRQLKMQADESEATRRRLESARNDVVKQVTAIVAEKDSLERENARLKDALRDIERKTYGRRSNRNIAGLEKEVSDLKLVAKQSATLNSQLKKGMKHLASCRRRKCSVCAYTRATFGEYHSARGGGNLLSCFHSGGGLSLLHQQEKKLKHQLSGSPSQECDSCSPTPDLSFRLTPHNISFIDEDSSSDEDAHYAPSQTSTAPHAFSSDSGFSSELTDPSPAKSFTRATRWTSSFRKLIRRVSKKHPTNTT